MAIMRIIVQTVLGIGFCGIIDYICGGGKNDNSCQKTLILTNLYKGDG